MASAPFCCSIVIFILVASAATVTVTATPLEQPMDHHHPINYVQIHMSDDQCDMEPIRQSTIRESFFHALAQAGMALTSSDLIMFSCHTNNQLSHWIGSSKSNCGNGYNGDGAPDQGQDQAYYGYGGQQQPQQGNNGQMPSTSGNQGPQGQDNTETGIPPIGVPNPSQTPTAPQSVTSPVSTNVSTPPTSTAQYDAMAMNALQYTNDHRASRGLVPLLFDSTLYSQAYAHSQGMPVYGFQHSQLSALTPPAGAYISAENIAMSSNTADPARDAVNMWINSPGHEANMVGDHTYCAVGIYIDGSGFWATQVFAKAT
mmetsp:Transcript_3140/g.5432  ORF Transcript_3140/g.5432 Transcript_3140/m.5432 type:complete len:315 (+) Transcript_3140:41-985(+)